MPDIDFFDFFRYALGTVVTVYAVVITLQSLWGWYVWLTGSDKYVSLVRRYLVVHGLRLRFRTFWGDVIISLLLCVAFMILFHAHHLIYDMEKTLSHVTDHASIHRAQTADRQRPGNARPAGR